MRIRIHSVHVMIHVSVYLADGPAVAVGRIAVPYQRGWCILRVRAMRPDVLLHVILPRKRLVADRTVDTLLPRVLLPMARRMPRRRERGRAAVTGRIRAGILVLSRSFAWGWVSRPAQGRLR